MKQTFLIVGAVIVLLLGFVWFLKVQQPNSSLGNVVVTGTCNGTTTTAAIGRLAVLATGSGNLCSVLLTGSAAQTLTLYDATTTNINLRTGRKATSSITLASFGISPTVGNYPFNVNFFDGLILDTSGAYATATVTYRP